jgi:hypothetical protein
MIRFFSAVLWCLMHVPLISFGQLTETDSTKFNTLLSVNGNSAFGNVERILIFTTAEAIVSSENRKWVCKTQNNYRYGTVKSNRTENDFVLVDYIYHQPFKKVYPFVMASYENSLIKRIRHRIGGGLGMTVVPIKNETSLLKFSVTAFFDRTIYDTKPIEGAQTSSRVINTMRPAVRTFGWHKLNERVTFFYEFIDQMSVSKAGGHRLIGAAGFNYGYSEIVALISRLNYTHEDLTAQGVKTDDWFLTFGISLHNKR